MLDSIHFRSPLWGLGLKIVLRIPYSNADNVVEKTSGPSITLFLKFNAHKNYGGGGMGGRGVIR